MPPAAGLAPGYYPAVGWPEGTVVAWDGRSWHPPVTVPGYYEGPGGGQVWWNGHAWAPEVVAGRPSPPSASRSRGGPAHRRRRDWSWHAARAALVSGATVMTLVLAAQVR